MGKNVLSGTHLSRHATVKMCTRGFVHAGPFAQFGVLFLAGKPDKIRRQRQRTLGHRTGVGGHGTVVGHRPQPQKEIVHAEKQEGQERRQRLNGAVGPGENQVHRANVTGAVDEELGHGRREQSTPVLVQPPGMVFVLVLLGMFGTGAVAFPSTEKAGPHADVGGA